jgi:KAP-like P-loop domain-containing protein
MATGQPVRHELRTYADRPITAADQDRYGFLSYADAFALLLNDAHTATPLTVAISGPWGSGKTSLAQLLEARLKVAEYWTLGWDTPPITCWFNALLHRDAPHLGAALAASVTRQISVERPLLWRLLSPLPSTMLSPQRRAWRRVWFGVASAALALVAVLLVLAFFPELRPKAGALGRVFAQWQDQVSVLWAVVPAGVALLRSVYRIADSVGTFVDAPRSAAAMGTIADVREQLGRIIRQAQRRRFRGGRHQRRVVIFVDDLERCPADKALDMCEAATQLLGHDDVITVLVADLDLIESAAATRYEQVNEVTGTPDPQLTADIGREYLHKLVQLRFNLPPLDRAAVASALGLAGGHDQPAEEQE